MLRQGPPPPRSTAPRRQPATPLTSGLRRSTTGNGNSRERSSTHSATTQPFLRTCKRKALSQAFEATFSTSRQTLRVRDYIGFGEPALTTPQAAHLPLRTSLTTICSRGPYGRWRRRHLQQTRTMVGWTCALHSIVNGPAGDVARQRRTQKGPPGTVLVKYSRSLHGKRQLIL